MLISPLARKLCTRQGIDPATLQGTGPRGRIMAADVRARRKAPTPRGTVRRRPAASPTRADVGGYRVYDACADMTALAAVSLPIAVQCEKLLEQRYSLFDYIIRAVVKACCAGTAWGKSTPNVHLLLFEQEGARTLALPDAADKSIYRLARELSAPTALPEGENAHIVICDTRTTRASVAAQLPEGAAPVFALVVRGGSPKVGIRAGREQPNDFMLEYSFYADHRLDREETDAIAARLNTLLCSPVALLLLS